MQDIKYIIIGKNGDTERTIAPEDFVKYSGYLDYDVKVTQHGSIYQFKFATNEARDWWNNKISDDEDNVFNKNNCVAEHRYAVNIVEGMRKDGLSVC